MNEVNGLESFLSCSATVSRPNDGNSPDVSLAQTLERSKATEDNASDSGPAFLRNYHANENNDLNILGIDPGNSGAIAHLQAKKGQKDPIFRGVWDLPSKEVKGRKRLEIQGLVSLVSGITKDKNSGSFIAAVEKVGQVRTNADPFSAFVFGFATGATHGVLTCLGIRIFPVTPLVWKTSLGLSSDKSKSIEMAQRLYPSAAPFIKKIKHHDRAEAILIAHFLSGVISRD